ncbi:MAG: DUF1667 domain-containing protein [Eubacteriales bacterium]
MKTKQQTITCTVCPKGCRVTVTFDDQGKVKKITGNSCSKGEAYARAELVDPKRVLTSTVRISGSAKPVVSVKTDAPVPLKKMMDCMAELNKVNAKSPIKMGDVLIENIAGTKANVVATCEAEAI